MATTLSMEIGKSYWQAMKRIMAGEEGVYEKIIKSFSLDPGQLAILTELEERRKKGEFNEK